jgi:hypothetical protein
MDIEALRDLIVGNVTSLEGVEAMLLSLILRICISQIVCCGNWTIFNGLQKVL